jgi:hypothetical protein
MVDSVIVIVSRWRNWSRESLINWACLEIIKMRLLFKSKSLLFVLDLNLELFLGLYIPLYGKHLKHIHVQISPRVTYALCIMSESWNLNLPEILTSWAGSAPVLKVTVFPLHLDLNAYKYEESLWYSILIDCKQHSYDEHLLLF